MYPQRDPIDVTVLSKAEIETTNDTCPIYACFFLS